jgi:low affinity iron permease
VPCHARRCDRMTCANRANAFAFLILFGYGALWYLYRPETFEWHAGATMATWFMTLVIQRAEHRDTQAIHVKLDEMWFRAITARINLPSCAHSGPVFLRVPLHGREGNFSILSHFGRPTGAVGRPLALGHDALRARTCRHHVAWNFQLVCTFRGGVTLEQKTWHEKAQG